MFYVLIDVISKTEARCQLIMKAQHLQTTSNGTDFLIKSLHKLAAAMNLIDTKE
jgi:hypothetical protein